MKKTLKTLGTIALIILPCGFLVLGIYKVFIEKNEGKDSKIQAWLAQHIDKLKLKKHE